MGKPKKRQAIIYLAYREGRASEDMEADQFGDFIADFDLDEVEQRAVDAMIEMIREGTIRRVMVGFAKEGS